MVPVLAPATVLTTLEAVFGQFYIAIVVAQLVGARLSRERQRSSSLPKHQAFDSVHGPPTVRCTWFSVVWAGKPGRYEDFVSGLPMLVNVTTGESRTGS